MQPVHSTIAGGALLLRRGLGWSWRGLRRRWASLAFVLLCSALFVWVANDAFTTRMVTISQSADYWEHSATLRALLDDVWQPKNPHLLSGASSPRFVPSFIVSVLLAKAFGLDALGAMGIASGLHMLLLLTGVFAFFRSYFRDARAPLYGLIVMFGSWYDAWHFSNVYQLKIFFSVVSYPSTAALGLSLLGFTTTLRALREPIRLGWLALTVVILALLMITHPLTAMLGFAGAGLLAATEREVPWRLRLKVVAAIGLAGLLSLFWPYFSVRAVLTGGSHEEVAAIARGFAGQDVEPSGRLHAFYRQRGLLRALGGALLGLPISLYLIVRRQHWFISLGALAMLLPFVVNAYVPLPLGHRFILLAIFFLQAALVWLLLKLSPRSPQTWSRVTVGLPGIFSGLLVASVLLTFLWWNVEAAFENVAYTARKMRSSESVNVRYARSVGQLAGSAAVIIADARSGWPVPTFGPKVLTLLHGNPLVPDEGEREVAVARFFHPSTRDGARLQIIESYHVTHVLARRATARRIESFLSRYAQRRAVPGGYSLYTLRASPNAE